MPLSERPALTSPAQNTLPDDAPITETVDAAPEPTFADFGLPDAIVSVLARRGMAAPFPIQSATLPDALAGRDVLGRGRTGSGKTLAFGLPALTRLAAAGPVAPHRPRGLILVPTRELATQVRDALEPLGRAVGVRLAVVVGGAPFSRQISQLRHGTDLVVATPGRLTDLIEQGACDLGDVEITVLDEADQMCDMGFLPAVTELLDQVRPGGQRMLFSATLDGDVDALVSKYLTEPATHSTDPGTASISTMEHHLVYVAPRDKTTVIAQIAGRDGRTLLFVRTRTFADRLEEELRAVGVRARALHGGKTQAVRTRTLSEFRQGRVNALVATDVAARGIHVDDVSLVLHVDPAGDPKDYLHRAGRTARAGESGTVVTLVTPRQRRSTESITRQAGVMAGRLRLRLDSDDVDAGLAKITGAQQPSGVPVPPEPEPVARRGGRPRRSSGDGARGYSGRSRGPRSADRGDGGYRADRGGAVGGRGGQRDSGFRGERGRDGDRPFRGGSDPRQGGGADRGAPPRVRYGAPRQRGAEDRPRSEHGGRDRSRFERSRFEALRREAPRFDDRRPRREEPRQRSDRYRGERDTGTRGGRDWAPRTGRKQRWDPARRSR